jgi:O-6-methylguanine DNA methyltransferase
VITYATAATPVGRLLVARTARGVRFVTLGRTDRAVVARLLRAHPGAVRDTQDLAAWIRRVRAHLAGRRTRLDLPIDIAAGTPFQRRVWAALRRIPRGRTRTYAEIARAVGRPGAARAVGAACGANPVPLVVPCHRVVAAGGLGGFGLGASLKRALLAAERRP